MAQLLGMLLPNSVKILNIGSFATSDPSTKIVRFEYDPYPVSSFTYSNEESSPEEITEIKCLVPDILVVHNGRSNWMYP